MDNRCDTLYLSYNCRPCNQIEIEVHCSEAILDNEWRGKDGQALHTILIMTSSATRAILDAENLHGRYTPVLRTWNGEIYDTPETIIDYLRRQGGSD